MSLQVQAAAQSTSASEIISETSNAPLETNQNSVNTDSRSDGTNVAQPENKSLQPEKKDEAQSFSYHLREKKEFRKREETLNQKIKELESKLQSGNEAESFDKHSPTKILEHYGMSLEDAIKESLGQLDPNTKATRELSARLAQLEKEKEEAVKKEKETKQREEDSRQITEAKQTLKAELDKTGADDFEFVKLAGSDGIDLVFDVMAEWYFDKKERITFAQAAEMVEASLASRLDPYLSAKKVQKRFVKEEPKPSQSDTTETDSREQFSKTITNTPTDTPQTMKPTKKKSRQDEIDEVIDRMTKSFGE